MNWTFPRPFPVHRADVMAAGGVIASAHPLATSAGVDVLRRGGSFMDAALATAAVLNVVEPYNSNLGGDVFMIVHDAATGTVTAINGSGAAPLLATPDRFPTGRIPGEGLAATTVPGEVSGWLAAHERWCRWSLADIFASAIRCAEEGFPANRDLCRAIAGTQERIAPFPSTRRIFGTPPRPGERWANPDLGRTLRLIAAGGRRVFYEGQIADRIAEFCTANGGLICREDLAAHETQVGPPIATTYRGFTVCEQPLVSQGHILVEELNICEGFDFAALDPLSADVAHVGIEAKKLAFADKIRYSGDPHAGRIPIDMLVSKEFAAVRRREIDVGRANPAPEAGRPIDHDTTYFCVADRDGNAVSFIQSIFAGFGCGVVIDGTGMLMNNRMCGFSLDPASPNVLVPGKRPVHTLNAYMIFRETPGGLRPYVIGGTPGGDAQVQTNLQVIEKLIDYGWSPQEAIEAPRWTSGARVEVSIESRFPEATLAELRRRGHDLRDAGPFGGSGHAQAILVDPESGALIAGSDPRCDGCAMGW